VVRGSVPVDGAGFGGFWGVLWNIEVPLTAELAIYLDDTTFNS
jgi:hypothetical protein